MIYMYNSHIFHGGGYTMWSAQQYPGRERHVYRKGQLQTAHLALNFVSDCIEVTSSNFISVIPLH